MNLFELIHNAMKSKMNIHTERMRDKSRIHRKFFSIFHFFYRKIYNATVRVNHHRIGNSHDANVASSISNILNCL